MGDVMNDGNAVTPVSDHGRGRDRSAMSRADVRLLVQTLKRLEPVRGIRPESATVYRGGGRRWFTKPAAERAEARKLLKSRCECCKGDWQTPAYTCLMHRDPVRFERMVRLTVAMVVRRSFASNTEPSS